MLLIEPPLSCDEWSNVDTDAPTFQCLFSHYCDDYMQAVLSLPLGQIGRIIAHFTSGLEHCPIAPVSFHRIVDRELSEPFFEPSGKVARLVILCALANTLQCRGQRFCNETERMLTMCREMIPICLMLAVDDHFGMLQVECC